MTFSLFCFVFINWINAWNEATEWGFFNINLIIAATNFFLNSETYMLHMVSFILNTQSKWIKTLSLPTGCSSALLYPLCNGDN